MARRSMKRRRCMSPCITTSTLLCSGNTKEEYEEEEVYESLYNNINSLVFRQHQGGV
jgi:hypothetical protein